MSQTRLAILGANGTLAGQTLHHFSGHAEVALLPFSKAEVDITQPQSIRAMLHEHKPGWILNAAAFINPDRCEENPATSLSVNTHGANNVARAIAELAPHQRPALIHISTDFVFDGKTGGYDETSAPRPLCYYALHKYMADDYMQQMDIPHYVLRVASVLGAGAGRRDFIKALLGLVAKGHKRLTVNHEYEISLSSTQLIATIIEQLIEKRPGFGLYHCVANGKTTWFDVAQTAFAALELSIPIDPVPASAFPMLAPRPVKSWLKNDKLAAALGPLPDWQQVVRDQVALLRPVYMELMA